MKQFITKSMFLFIFVTSSLSYGASDNISQQIQLLNSQIQGQLQKIQADQQKQMKQLNEQIQAQLAKLQTTLQEQIQQVNTQTQNQIKQVVSTLQQQIQDVQKNKPVNSAVN